MLAVVSLLAVASSPFGAPAYPAEPTQPSAILSQSAANANAATSHSPDPQREAGLFARATFSWLNPTLRLGSQRPLLERDLPALPKVAGRATDRFEREWNRMQSLGASESPNAVAIALFRAFGKE